MRALVFLSLLSTKNKRIVSKIQLCTVKKLYSRYLCSTAAEGRSCARISYPQRALEGINRRLLKGSRIDIRWKFKGTAEIERSRSTLHRPSLPSLQQQQLRNKWLIENAGSLSEQRRLTLQPKSTPPSPTRSHLNAKKSQYGQKESPDHAASTAVHLRMREDTL